MFDSAKRLEKKRDDIIMACLSGGQNIDAALEAADRLVPVAQVEEARAFDKKMAGEYEAILKERSENLAIDLNSYFPRKKTSWWEELVEKIASLGRF